MRLSPLIWVGKITTIRNFVLNNTFVKRNYSGNLLIEGGFYGRQRRAYGRTDFRRRFARLRRKKIHVAAGVPLANPLNQHHLCSIFEHLSMT